MIGSCQGLWYGRHWQGDGLNGWGGVGICRGLESHKQKQGTEARCRAGRRSADAVELRLGHLGGGLEELERPQPALQVMRCMVMQRQCSGDAVVLQWQCSGDAVAMQW